MGRHRLPSPRRSIYITPAGAEQLRAELDRLWRVDRPPVTQAVSDAAALGDRSENAEYIYGKKRLREIDRRIRFLQKRLDEIVVVDRPPADPSRVFFGAWVRLEDASGREFEYRIVGARALLKKALDDDVSVDLPNGRIAYTVVDVRYEP